MLMAVTEQRLIDDLHGSSVEVYETMRIIRGFYGKLPMEQAEYLKFLRRYLEVRLLIDDYHQEFGHAVHPPLYKQAMTAIDSVWFANGIKSIWHRDEEIAVYVQMPRAIPTVIYDVREAGFLVGRPQEFSLSAKPAE